MPVKPIKTIQDSANNVNPASTDTMIHHNERSKHPRIIIPLRSFHQNSRTYGIANHYGVSPTGRILTPGLFQKRYNEVRQCLASTLGLTTAQREVVLRLLTYWSYYGKVYPKAAQVCELPGCSRATFWRTIAALEDRGLLSRVNRFLTRPEAQTSNLYNLINLIIVIARYLNETGRRVFAKWIKPLLDMPGRSFWRCVTAGQLSLFSTFSLESP